MIPCLPIGLFNVASTCIHFVYIGKIRLMPKVAIYACSKK